MRLFLVGCLLLVCAVAAVGATAWVPGVRIALEVTTPSGELRTYHTPPKFTYWSPELPIIQGDKVKVDAFVAIGGGELDQVRMRLDNVLLATLKKEPWQLVLPADKLQPGYHFLEVWASSKNKKWASSTLSFLVVPATEPSIRVAVSPQAAATVTVTEPAPGEPTGPTAVVRSRTEAVDKAVQEGKPVPVNESTLFFIESAAGKQYFYTLERGGVVTYRSPALPLNTQILLEPKQGDKPGLEPGEVTMKVRAGDLAGNYGSPTTVQLVVGGKQ